LAHDGANLRVHFAAIVVGTKQYLIGGNEDEAEAKVEAEAASLAKVRRSSKRRPPPKDSSGASTLVKKQKSVVGCVSVVWTTPAAVIPSCRSSVL
jgi:ABC-type transport system involved in cytochrome bd biosynthesis fused ATPase/permease subunit